MIVSNTLAQTIGSAMVVSTIAGCAVAGIVVALRRALAHRSPELRYGVALSCWSVVALTPLAAALLVDANAAPSTSAATSSATWNPSLSLAGPLSVPNLEAATPWVAHLATPWLCGALACYVWLGFGFFGARRTRSRTQPVARRISDQLTTLSAEIGLRSNVVVRTSTHLLGPVLVGILRPTIVIPLALANRLTPTQLEFVLLHELGHLVRRDNLVLLLQRAAAPLTFFQPGAWIVSRWLQEEREHCCDAWVLRRRGAAREYAFTLLQLASAPPPLQLHAAMSGAPLTARIRRILGNPAPESRHSTRSPGATALLLVGLSIVGLLVFQETSQGSSLLSLARALRSEYSAADSPPPSRCPAHAHSNQECSTCHVSSDPAPLPPGKTDPGDDRIPHPPFGDAACSDCHVVTVTPDRPVPLPLPEGHGHAGDTPCSTCHVPGSLPRTASGAPILPPPVQLPPGHPHPSTDTPCSTCHVPGTLPMVQRWLPAEPPAPQRLPDGHPLPSETPCSACHVPGSLSTVERWLPTDAPPPRRLPHHHPDTGETPCSACHVPGSLPVERWTPAEPKLTLPKGHAVVGETPCSACHVVGSLPQPEQPSSTPLPPGHPHSGDAACSNCHVGPGSASPGSG